jgi:hypothetical protein
LIKNALIDFCFWMANLRNNQGQQARAKADWWIDLSRSIETGRGLAEIRAARHQAEREARS